MTPTSPVTPLTSEEEAKFRESVAYLASDAFEQDELPLQWSNHAAQRLLATLDASRAVTETRCTECGFPDRGHTDTHGFRARAVTETPEGLDAAWEAAVAALPVGGRLTAIFETWDADMRRTGHVGLKRTRQEAAEGLNWLATRLAHKEEHGG